MYAASLGCEVHTFEAIPAFVNMIQLQRKLNPSLAEKIHVFPRAVSTEDGGVATLQIPLGTKKKDGQLVRRYGNTHVGHEAATNFTYTPPFRKDKSASVTVATTRIDTALRSLLAANSEQSQYQQSILKGGGLFHSNPDHAVVGPESGRVCGMKVDVEGYEPYAIESAREVLALTENLVFEMNSHFICQPVRDKSNCLPICQMWELLVGKLGFKTVRKIGFHRRDSMKDTSPATWKLVDGKFDQKLSGMSCKEMLFEMGGGLMERSRHPLDWPYKNHFSINLWMSKE